MLEHVIAIAGNFNPHKPILDETAKIPILHFYRII